MNNKINYSNKELQTPYLSNNEGINPLNKKIFPSISSGFLNRLLPKDNLVTNNNKDYLPKKDQVTKNFESLVSLEQNLKSDYSKFTNKNIPLMSSVGTALFSNQTNKNNETNINLEKKINKNSLENLRNKDNISLFLSNNNNNNLSNNILNNKNNITIPLSLYPKAIDLPLNSQGFFGLNLNRSSKYIKLISQFNPEMAGYQNISYKFNNTRDKTVNFNLVYKIIEAMFKSMSAVISKPFLIKTPLKITINLFFYVKPNNDNNKDINIFSENIDKLQILCGILSKLYNKPVELEMTRVYYPYHDANILVNIMGQICNKVRFRNITRRLLRIATIINPTKMNKFSNHSNNTIVPYKLIQGKLIPAYLSGIKVRVAGRLLTQKVVPRYTVDTIQRGSLARGKANYVSTARFTNKNKNGSYSITVTTGHVIV